LTGFGQVKVAIHRVIVEPGPIGYAATLKARQCQQFHSFVAAYFSEHLLHLEELAPDFGVALSARDH